MLTARGTKWSASSALNAYGRPCLTPHSLSARPPASTAASPTHASRAARSRRRERVPRVTRASGAALGAVGIDGVVATRVDAPEARLRDLVVRVVADVDDRLDEHRRPEREHRDAAGLQAVLEPVRVALHVGAS